MQIQWKFYLYNKAVSLKDELKKKEFKLWAVK